jgi:uncharacterized protein YprB with RNaseH-like and TPR domain
MKRLIIGLGLVGIIAVGLVFIKFNGRFNSLTSTRAKDFKDLNIVDRTVMEYDSVYGDHLQWTGVQDLGEGEIKSITRKLVMDKPNKFAIKASFVDKSGFFTKVPGDISYSGQWTEENEQLTLNFYFPPEIWHELFDSIKNESIKFIDDETITLDKNVETIWIMGTECKRSKLNVR